MREALDVLEGALKLSHARSQALSGLRHFQPVIGLSDG